MAGKDTKFFANTTRTIAKKLNQQVSRVRDLSGFPADVLNPEEVDFQFLQHIGFPEAADGVAYEPVQRLLAVSIAINCLQYWTWRRRKYYIVHIQHFFKARIFCRFQLPMGVSS